MIHVDDSPMDSITEFHRGPPKSNITSGRLTLLPGFLSRGVTSKMVRKAKPPVCEYDHILNENLHGLLQNSSPSPPRRPQRKSKKNQNFTASSYYVEVLSDAEPQTSSRSYSKSIFKEIEEKYAQHREETPYFVHRDSQLMPSGRANPPEPLFREPLSSSLPWHNDDTLDSLTPHPGFLKSERAEQLDHEPVVSAPRRSSRLSKKCASIFKEVQSKYEEKLEEKPVNHDFGARLVAQLSRNVAVRPAGYYKDLIYKEVRGLNAALVGKAKSKGMSSGRKRACNEEDKENFPMKFPIVPESKWVFQTPPNRKLNYSHVKVEENCIRPAVVENCQERKVVYEMNNKVNVDLSQFHNKQQIEIDNRYMVDASFREQEGNMFQFTRSNTFELENHFLSLTCRPKKAQMTVSRIAGQKRKREREFFEPEAGCSTDAESLNEFESNFTFLNNLTNLEESFTFKFTANEYPEDSATGHLFDFDGNQKDTFNFRY